MRVVLYGARSGVPSTVDDPLWLQLANARNLNASSTIKVKTVGQSMRTLLVWSDRAGRRDRGEHHLVVDHRALRPSA